jgi:hypothetical protein
VYIILGHDATIFKTNNELSDVVIGCFDCQSRYQWKVIVMDRHHGSSIYCFCCVVCGSVGQTSIVTFVGWKCQICVDELFENLHWLSSMWWATADESERLIFVCSKMFYESIFYCTSWLSNVLVFTSWCSTEYFVNTRFVDVGNFIFCIFYLIPWFVDVSCFLDFWII